MGKFLYLALFGKFNMIWSLRYSFAYMEFADKDAVNTAMALDDSLFRGRQIKVSNRLIDKLSMAYLCACYSSFLFFPILILYL